MTTISKEHSDRLYWLGRYTERAERFYAKKSVTEADLSTVWDTLFIRFLIPVL